jgi:hypothetical protein
LKPRHGEKGTLGLRSPPARGRGLKPIPLGLDPPSNVAPARGRDETVAAGATRPVNVPPRGR